MEKLARFLNPPKSYGVLGRIPIYLAAALISVVTFLICYGILTLFGL